MQISSADERTRARLYLELAERHQQVDDDPRLIAALVRAAWRAHESADRAVAPLPPVAARYAGTYVALGLRRS